MNSHQTTTHPAPKREDANLLLRFADEESAIARRFVAMDASELAQLHFERALAFRGAAIEIFTALAKGATP